MRSRNASASAGVPSSDWTSRTCWPKSTFRETPRRSATGRAVALALAVGFGFGFTSLAGFFAGFFAGVDSGFFADCFGDFADFFFAATRALLLVRSLPQFRCAPI